MDLLKNKHLFWDTDINNIDALKHKQAIIERVIERGSWTEFKELLDYYGRSATIEAIKKSRCFSEKTMHFVSGYFDIPLRELRCFTQKQLTQKHYL